MQFDEMGYQLSAEDRFIDNMHRLSFLAQVVITATNKSIVPRLFQSDNDWG